MVISALRRLPTFEDIHQCMEECNRICAVLFDERSKNGKNRMKEEHWTIETGGDASALKILSDEDGNGDVKQIQEISNMIQQMRILATESIPEIVSRIMHATSPIICELSRGYFVPLLTVALSCLGRIHTLLQKVGRDLVILLQEVVPQLRRFCKTNKGSGNDAKKRLNDLVMPTFAVEAKKNAKQSLSPQREGTPSDEWDDLMTYFFDLSQDALMNRINKFVKDKQLSDCVSRFGGDTADFSGPPTEQNVKNEGGVPIGELEGAISTTKSEEGTIFDGLKPGDTGELMNSDLHPTQSSSIKLSPSDVLDDNMARILKRGKGVQISATPSAAASKKRRKKKKRKSSTIKEAQQGNEEQSQLPNRARTVDENNHESCQEVEMNSKGVKESAAVQPGDSGNATDAIVELSPDATKAKKKKKKGNKNKRKSSSIIDDIFGS